VLMMLSEYSWDVFTVLFQNIFYLLVCGEAFSCRLALFQAGTNLVRF
jgi:hypothetical protein